MLEFLLGKWRANDTLRALHPDMEAGDAELMTSWLRKHHAITLKPFIKVKQPYSSHEQSRFVIAQMQAGHLLL